jgi:tRNA A37 N6-isopentenylltransferase MiaA
MTGKDLSEIMQELKETDPESYEEIENNVKERVKKIRGGARHGAGRPKIYPVRLKRAYELDENTLKLIEEIAKEKHVSKNEVISIAVNHLAKCKAI